MKTMLIPVDFSATSANAVEFAAHWSRHYGYRRIILLKSFYDTVFDDVVISAEYGNVNRDYRMRERQEGERRLEELCRHLEAEVGKEVQVATATSERPLLRAIIELVEDEAPELIVAGSDNVQYSSDSYISGNLIAIAKASPVRLLIVPANYRYVPVETALLPINFDTLDSLGKLHNLHATAQWHEVRLEVLHVDPKERFSRPDETFRRREESLHEYLKNFRHQLHYASDKSIIDGILRFSRTHPVQLIIALPGRHSFLYSLTHKSISDAIYRNAKEPVLILK